MEIIVIGLMAVLLALVLFSFAAWLYLLFLRGAFWKSGPMLSPAGNLETWPAVAVIVPARNEAAVIGRTLESLCRLDYAGKLFVLLVDDGSRDGTVELAGKVAARAGHPVEIIPGKPLPAGWTGKLWAMAQGVERAGRLTPTRYIWFCDADIEHDPQALRNLVWKAESDKLDLVSTMALLHCSGLWERLLIPAFVFFFRKLYPFRYANTPGHPVAAAAGGSMLTRLEVLQRSGGLEQIRGELIDDCALAKLIKTNGRIWLGMTTHSRSVRAYCFTDIWRMVARSAYTQLRHSLFRLLAAVLGMLLIYVAPVVAVGFAWRSGDLPSAGLGGAAWALMILAYLPMLRLYRLPGLMAPLLPIAALLYVFMTIDSARRHWQGKGGMWKGRVQPH